MPFHCAMSRVGNGKDVGRSLIEFTSLVLLYEVGAIDVQIAIGVDRYEHLADVGVDAAFGKSRQC